VPLPRLDQFAAFDGSLQLRLDFATTQPMASLFAYQSLEVRPPVRQFADMVE
jgi:hypothetical protein